MPKKQKKSDQYKELDASGAEDADEAYVPSEYSSTDVEESGDPEKIDKNIVASPSKRLQKHVRTFIRTPTKTPTKTPIETPIETPIRTPIKEPRNVRKHKDDVVHNKFQSRLVKKHSDDRGLHKRSKDGSSFSVKKSQDTSRRIPDFDVTQCLVDVFQCPQCDRGYHTRSSLLRHQKIHDIYESASMFAYKCIYCTYKTVRRDHQASHLRRCRGRRREMGPNVEVYVEELDKCKYYPPLPHNYKKSRDVYSTTSESSGSDTSGQRDTKQRNTKQRNNNQPATSLKNSKTKGVKHKNSENVASKEVRSPKKPRLVLEAPVVKPSPNIEFDPCTAVLSSPAFMSVLRNVMSEQLASMNVVAKDHTCRFPSCRAVFHDLSSLTNHESVCLENPSHQSSSKLVKQHDQAKKKLITRPNKVDKIDKKPLTPGRDLSDMETVQAKRSVKKRDKISTVPSSPRRRLSGMESDVLFVDDVQNLARRLVYKPAAGVAKTITNLGVDLGVEHKDIDDQTDASCKLILDEIKSMSHQEPLKQLSKKKSNTPIRRSLRKTRSSTPNYIQQTLPGNYIISSVAKPIVGVPPKSVSSVSDSPEKQTAVSPLKRKFS